MKTVLRSFALALTFSACHAALAQAPATAPAGSTGICKDGTYSTAASKSGACRGHKGVQTWYMATKVTPAAASVAAPTPATSVPSVAAPKPTPTVPSVPAPTAAAAPAPKTNIAAERAKLLAGPPTPGGGPGLVWLNGSSKVYHCSTDDFYGKTKTGSYVTEADAKAKGAHPSHNKPCS